MAKNYRQTATKQYQPQHNQKVNAVNNQLNTTVNGLEQSRGGINQNYDTQVEKQNLMNTLAKNNYNNQMLGRGIGKSSIATSGMAGMDDSNSRKVGYINMDRTNSLNNVDSNIALARQNASNTISQLEADRLAYIDKLAYELEDRDFDKNFKNQQLAMQREAQQAEQAFRQQQLAFQREAQQAEASWRRQQASIGANKENMASQDDYMTLQAIMNDPKLTLQQKRDFVDGLQRSSKDEAYRSYAADNIGKLTNQYVIDRFDLNHQRQPAYEEKKNTKATNPFSWWGNKLYSGNAFGIKNLIDGWRK